MRFDRFFAQWSPFFKPREYDTPFRFVFKKEMQISSQFTRPHVISNPYDFFSVERKRRNITECPCCSFTYFLFYGKWQHEYSSMCV